MSELPARPGRLNGLRHIALLVPNLEECERFYVDVLGMEVLNRANEDLVYLTCGNDNLSLGRGAGAANGLQTLDHYGFIVDSVEELEAWYEYFKAHGVTLLDRPFNHGDGARSFHLLDPAGNKVQPLYHPALLVEITQHPGASASPPGHRFQAGPGWYR